ncbi:Transposon Tf2-9 polyprotein [Aduncisulcus paluster]|uniref:Transposon Tf2-9 polyprotein n=1 Tax=Aduncisulcus paluster TaxID=2918883 RepID=A0ABQ5JWP4_9EUKA|nr:Transposon Tf2-9 polyprotein [Aduncisulcus paluster]
MYEITDVSKEIVTPLKESNESINVNSEYQDKILDIVDSHKSVFAEKLPKEGSKLPQFSITLTNPRAIWSVKPRRFSPQDDKVLRENITKGLEDGILIRESSPYVCSPTFVDRPDGGVRMCINYIPLNRHTVPLQYPLPIITELLDSLSGNTIFGKIDARSGFHQIVVEKDSRKFLAFTTKYGVFQYTRMPFGARNAAAHFQQAMVSSFSDLIPSVCDIFVDDIIIKGRDIDEFCDNLDKVLQRFEDLNLRAKASKCVLGYEKLEFLGREVSKVGITPAPSRVADLKALKPPSDKSQVRSVLGLFNFFRSFVPNYATIIAPIQKLTRKGFPFVWNEDLQTLFEAVIEEISKRTLLHYIDYDKEIVLQSDASDLAVGGVLLQRGADKIYEPILFISKVLSEREQRWTTNEKEAYALWYCVQRCEHYLRGTKFTIHTDHANLRWMHRAKSRKVQRWWTYLFDFDFDIVHIPGTANVVADGLSRIGFGSESTSKRLILDLTDLWKKIEAAQSLFSIEEKEAYEELDGFLVDKHERKVIPKAAVELKKMIFNRFHNGTVGHHGAALTQFKIQDNDLTWASIATDLRDWIPACVTCQKIKGAPKKRVTRFRSEMEQPFHTICVDTMGPFPESATGIKYIIVIVDRFSRWTELFPAKTLEAQEACDAIMERVVARFGVPKNIISDGGKQFSCYLTDHLWDTFGVRHHVTTPAHSQSNGAVERVNREVKRHLYALVHDILDKPNWHVALPIIANVINHTRHSVTSHAPAELLFGKRDTTSLLKDWSVDRESSKSELPASHLNVDKYVKNLTDNIAEIIERSKRHLSVEKKASEVPDISPGTYVLIKRYPEPKKLEFPWEGPYQVIEKTSDVEYAIRSLLGARRYCHIDDIKILGIDIDLDKAMNSLAQDVGRRLPKKIIGKKGRGRNEKYEVQWYGLPEDKTTFVCKKEIESSLAFKEFQKSA